MFRKNKDAFPATPNPATDPVAEPTPTQAEVADLSTEQMALTERCGELVAASAAAFHRELAEARGRGLSVEDQEAFIKSLWATRKIPRVLSTPLRSHSVGVATVKPEMVDEVKIYDLEKVSERSAEAAFSTAVVDREIGRASCRERV